MTQNNDPWSKKDDNQFNGNPVNQNDSSEYKEKKTSEHNSEDRIKQLKAQMKSKIKSEFQKNDKQSKTSVMKIILIAFAAWLSTGIFTVKPDEMAVTTTFGKYHNTLQSGLNFHWPAPIGKYIKQSVTRTRSVIIGLDETPKSSTGTKRMPEGLMLTGDENIIDVQFEVQWRISDLKSYIFNINDPIKTVNDVSRSVVREIVSQEKISDILTKNRLSIETEAKNQTQEILNSYHSGVEIILFQMLKADPPHQVIDSFRDVQTARVDKESIINTANAYKREIMPKARGIAAKTISQANAKSAQIINNAKGDVSRISNIYQEYKKNPELIKAKIYTEAVQNVFENTNVSVVDSKIKTTFIPLSVTTSANEISTEIDHEKNIKK